ncbi:MAG: HNH endonuclease, partial [Actinomycetota bacterium]|nr:HNH endonuclease [Actinomycetota bacterium]
MSDRELVDVMGEAARDESTAIAQRLLAVGELYARHARLREEISWWISDPTEGVAAEVSAVQNISRARAVAQVRYGRVLRERLPRLARVFLRGTIDWRMVSTIIERSQNVAGELIAELDEALAARVEKWMKLSGPKLRDRVDQWVAKFDAEAVRVPAAVDEGRCVEIVPTEAGMAGIWGNVHAEDGAALSQRLDALAETVCANDPRTKAQRRADACGPLARMEASLPCRCGSEDCPAAAVRAEASAAVIHLLAERSTVEGTGTSPGYLPGFGILPAESVRELAKRAVFTPVPVPSPEAAPDAGYRPSAGTAEFVRWRDLTCRWPGCDQPAWRCDVDHTVPWPEGPTHASN